MLTIQFNRIFIRHHMIKYQSKEMIQKYEASVIVTSDSCYANPSLDRSGQYLVDRLKKHGCFKEIFIFIVPDDRCKITECISRCVSNNSALIITTGGTGLCPRDVTPEVSKCFYEKLCPGIASSLIQAGLKNSPHAALSRLTAGISKDCLIINFPGKLKACKECFDCLEIYLDHALEQVRFEPESIKRTHDLQERHDCNDLEQNLPKQVVDENICLGTAQERFDPTGADSDLILNHDYTAPLKSPYPMVDYSDALEILRKESESFNLEAQERQLRSPSDLHELVDEILAEDMFSNRLVPPYAVSTMDGYVLNLSDRLIKKVKSIGFVIARLVVSLDEFISRQHDPDPKVSGSFFCYRVNTGGKLPESNYVVVPVECTNFGQTNSEIKIQNIQLGKYIRSPGSDICRSDKIEKGTLIGPVELALILSMGYDKISIIRKPVIGILSTGDELVSFFEAHRNDVDGVIDVNSPLLSILYHKWGYKVVDCGISKDTPLDILLKVLESLSKCDILVITGGASMGSKDYVKYVIETMGGRILFGRVNIKPGKPAAFGKIDCDGSQKYIYSLPGNPVSAYMTSLVLLLPFLKYCRMSSLGEAKPESYDIIGTLITVELESITDSDDGKIYEFDGRLEFVRAKFSRSNKNQSELPLKVVVSIRQQSSRLLSIKDHDCLIVIDPSMIGSKFLVGQTYQALRLNN